MKLDKFLLSATVVTAVAFSGCSKDTEFLGNKLCSGDFGKIVYGGCDKTNSSEGVKEYTGQFIDAPVENLKYTTDSKTDKTDTNGTANYKAGETCTYYIGDLELGSIECSPIMTIYKMVGDTDITQPSQRTLNIARVLQSLDVTTTDTDLITLDEKISDFSAPAAVDLNSTSFETTLDDIITNAQTATGKTFTKVTEADANSTMHTYINNHFADLLMAPSVATTNSPAVGEALTLTLGKGMNPATINNSTVTLEDGSGNKISGTVAYDIDTKKITFTPSSNLTAGETYSLKVSTSVKDKYGNAFDSIHSSDFTISAASSDNGGSSSSAHSGTKLDLISISSGMIDSTNGIFFSATDANYDPILAHVNAGLTLDTGFNSTGSVALSSSVGGGSSTDNFAYNSSTGDVYFATLKSDLADVTHISKYDNSGTAVAGFGTGGVLTLSDNYHVTKMIVDSAGNLFVAGYGKNPSGGAPRDGFLSKYDSSGNLINAFDTDGTTSFNHVGDQRTLIEDMAIDSNGKIVVVGYGYNNSTSVDESFVKRFDGTTGALDSTFNSDGNFTITDGGKYVRAQSVALTSSDEVIVAFTSYDSNGGMSTNQVAKLAKIDDSGLVNGFGTSGVLSLTNFEAFMDPFGTPPTGITGIDSSDNIFMHGTGGKVVKVDSSGTETELLEDNTLKFVMQKAGTDTVKGIFEVWSEEEQSVSFYIDDIE